jgi:hypothetical protein
MADQYGHHQFARRQRARACGIHHPGHLPNASRPASRGPGVYGRHRTLLYGVSPHDTVSFAAAPFALTALAVAACIAPVVRALRIDPLRQLRE